MSGEDNFLARWSRRKREVGEAEEGANPPPSSSTGEEQAAETAPASAAEPVEPLPRIEDLTAESDLTAFLRTGVPEALKAAALRRMWSLDPAIRDFVGPAEYAYDFNDPASIPGFGVVTPGAFPPLNAGVPEFSTARTRSGEPCPTIGSPAAAPEDQERKTPGAGEPVGSITAEEAAPTAHGHAADLQVPPPSSTGEEPTGAAPHPRPRHGGAVPR